MPPRDPTKTQLDNPELVRDLITQLEIIGQVGLLDFIPAVNPVFIVGSRGFTIENAPPPFQSAQIVDGQASAPPVNTVIADTGQLPPGTYDIYANLGSSGISSGVFGHLQLQHRDAANAVTLAVPLQITWNASGNSNVWGNLPLTGYILANNERLRAQVLASNATGSCVAVIGARLRVTP